ncbi:MAG: sigma-70 family RNA polymerase sigma factor [Bacteroidaceae bacterium]|jgi:RNA polymerase sigma-70 factor (ECF subfamily)|nr:sigma-70 family RNA polymerase sigma factor [Bacteroidaceae bacterium]MBQ6225875.1 sigma-70 family RNA polymerase sigma factor [Bacteroidaceae bacterium]
MIDEKALLKQLRDASTKEAAFTRLVREYQEPLYWQIRRMVVIHDDADDVLQNTFIKAWSAIDSFRQESRLQTWLFRIAINESLNHLSKKKQVLSLDQTEIGIADTLASDSYFDGDEVQKQFQTAINSLPEKQRLVFNLKYFDEMKYEDMSDMLGTSIGALKASYHHAVKKISAFFNDND